MAAPRIYRSPDELSDHELLAAVVAATRRVESARHEWDAYVTQARDRGVSLARIADAAGVSVQSVRNAEKRRGRMEVQAGELRCGDRILAHREGDQTTRHRGWIVKEPYGIHPRAGVPGIQLERRPEDSENYLWPGTDYTVDTVFIIERP